MILSQSPWMTLEILKARKNRDKLKSKWIKAGHIVDSQEHKEFRKLRNKITAMKRLAKRNNLQKKCEEAKGDSEKLWRVVKSAMNHKPKELICIP